MAPTTTPSAAELVRRLSDVAAVCDELGVEVASLNVTDWGARVPRCNEDHVDAVAASFGLSDDDGALNYQRAGSVEGIGHLLAFCGRTRPRATCSCGQRCDHGAPS